MLILGLATGCATEGTLLVVPAPPPLALELDAPAHGAFAGDGPIVVVGRVTDPAATVLVEGEVVPVAADGSFSVDVPLEGAYRLVDVEARRELPDEPAAREPLAVARGIESLEEHRAVFAGVDPMTGWTGAVSVRLTEAGLDALATALALEVDALDLPGLLTSWIPSFEVLGFGFAPRSASAAPARVALDPSTRGIAVEITLDDLTVELDLSSPLTGTTPVVLGAEQAILGVELDLGLDEGGGLEVSFTDTTVELGRPVLELGGLDPGLLETLVEPVADWIAGALEGALDLGALLLPDLGLGEPISFEADLLGTPLSLSLGGLGTDDDGLGARLDVDLGVAPTADARTPTALEAGDAQLAVALHEGLLQGLLAGDLLALLDLDLRLDGVLGEVLALPLAALPGGEQLPPDRTGFCLSIDPGELRVARLEPGLAPLGRLILPDVALDVGVSVPGLDCGDWLEASLALEALLVAEGSTVGVELALGDGRVLSYAAEGEHDEAAVLDGLGALVDSATALLGGSLALDLQDLLGGVAGDLPLPELAPRLVSAEAPADGAVGQVIVTLDLLGAP